MKIETLNMGHEIARDIRAIKEVKTQVETQNYVSDKGDYGVTIASKSEQEMKLLYKHIIEYLNLREKQLINDLEIL